MNVSPIIIAPSILSADFRILQQEIEDIEPHADWLQVDVWGGNTAWVEKKCMTSNLIYHKDTLKKDAVICKTKNQFKEFVGNLNNQLYLIQMMANGKCLFNKTNAEIHVEILDGILPYNKVKVYWGDTIFVGWTDAIMIN